MPVSFKVLHDPIRKTDTIIADFGESAIRRVAPVDSGFWWIVLLRAYTKFTGDLSLAETPECQKGMRLIWTLCLSGGFDAFPTLFCADGCSMVDRRMGIYGYPIEIQALFFHGTENVLGSGHLYTFWAPREEDDEHWLEIKVATEGATCPIPLFPRTFKMDFHKNLILIRF